MCFSDLLWRTFTTVFANIDKKSPKDTNFLIELLQSLLVAIFENK